MTLYLIRHGETRTSGSTYAGRTDVALNTQGRRQAAAIAADLAGRPPTSIYCSPLSRALDSARPLASACGLEPITDPLLMEIDFGIYEGQSKSALGLVLRKSHAYRPVPGGESLQDVWLRAGRFLTSIAQYHGERPCIAIVGHFWINRMLWGHLDGRSFEATCRSREYRPSTGSVLSLDAMPHAGSLLD